MSATAHPVWANLMAGEIEYANRSTHCVGCDIDLRGPIASEVLLAFEGRGIVNVYEVKVCLKCAMRMTSYPANRKVRDAVTRAIHGAVGKMDHDRAGH